MTKRKYLRRTAWVVLVTFTVQIMQPVQAAILAPPAKPASRPAPSETSAEKQSRLLGEIHGILKELEPEAAYGTPASGGTAGGGSGPVMRNIGPNILGRTPAGPAADRAAKIEALKTKQAQLAQLFADADAEFDAVRQHLVAKNLPPSILARQTQAVNDYHQRRAEYERLMQAVLDADARKADTTGPLRDLAAFMAQHPNQRTHTPTDPHKLPFSTRPGKVRAPIETAQGFRTNEASPFNPRNRYGWPAYSVAAAGSLSGIGLPSSIVSAIPTAADLAATEDVQITPAIQAQAAALHNNPVEIHNWVRNTIEFIPSYGSIQGSELTFQSKRGNAFDTASLEIALLRAAGTPARYVYGTVQIPADPVMNWVGGVTTPEAAQSLLGQGGIPNVAVISGGKIASFRFEHVWVEAYVDYLPSRGAVNRTGDTWIPLDASFKQYDYTPGMDLQSAVPLDAQTLLDQIKTGATINETEGWIQNPNSAAIQTALTDYQTQLQTYIDSQNPNATVGDVLGTKQIVPQSPSILMGTLPYRTLVTGAEFAAMPDNLKHQFRFKLYASDLDRALDSPILTLTQDLPALAAKKITLSFTPATQADLDLINSYLPAPHADGTPIDPSELPSSLPGYLIHLKAEIRVDGQVVQAGGDFTMGQELTSAMGLNFPGKGWEETPDNHPIAGEYDAIGLDLQGISASQLTALQSKIEQTKAKIDQYQANPTDTTPISDLTKEDFSGDLLYSGILGYFAGVDSSDQLTARARKGIVAYRLPSYGLFLAAAQPRYWFGIAQSVTFPGVIMDVDNVSYHVEAKDADQQKRLAYMRQVGSSGSVLEHVVPERMFADPTLPLGDPSQPQGVSAVKAIAIAASQGQKIYTLNAQNQAYHASIINGLNTDADTKAEITNALAAGMEVTVHQSDVTINGWTGSGYIMLDPDTGAGAYKIGGGANGGFTDLQENLKNILLWIENLAQGFIEQYGGLVSKAISGIKSLYDQVVTFYNLLSQCPLTTAIAGIVSFSLMVAGFVPAITAAFAVNPVYGLLVAAGGGVLAGVLSDSFINSCRR